MRSLLAVVALLLPLQLQAQSGAAPAAANDHAPEVGAPAAAAPAKQKQRIPFLHPAGVYEDLPEIGFDPTSLLMGGGAQPKAFFKLIEALDGLAKVPESEVMLDLSEGVGLNLAQQREVERAMVRIKKAGKRVICYLENASSSSVQLAAQCDEVLMADMGMLDMRSPALSVMHMKDALDLLGVQVEVTRVGAYKGAVEPYMLPSMSPHLRAHYEAMLKSMNADVVRRIAAGRGIAEAAVRELQAQRLITAKDAKAKGLVDRLVPWSGAERGLAAARGDCEFELIDTTPKKKRQSRDLMAILGNMLRQSKEEEIEDPMLVVLHLAGQIVDGKNPVPGSMVSGVCVKKIDELAENDLVRGVVVRINSPGGSATASEEIRQALQRLADRKPVVFSMGELAASGGYWITTIGSPILAEVGTITGSIGVFGTRFQAGALMRRLGLHTDVVSLDDGPLMDAMDRPLGDEAKAHIQAFVDDVYDRFLANVAASRHKTKPDVDAIAGGRVWSGQQAVENGLVDAIGGVDDAVAMVRKAAGIGDDVEVQHQPEPKNFADSLFSSMFESSIAASADAAALRGLLARWSGCAEVIGLLRDALTSDGTTRVYATLPPGLRVR